MPAAATTFPFDIPPRLIERLPRPARNGYVYADVRFRGSWEGIVVIDGSHRCVGVYVGRKIVEFPLPFGPEEIEDFRKPALSNRLLAQLPSGLDPYATGVLTILILGPVCIVAAALVSAWIALLAVPVAWTGIWLMYQVRGFPFLRLFLAMLGVAIALTGVSLLVHSR